MKQRKDQQVALNEMADWLSHSQEFGEKPVKLQIIYERDVSWPCEGYPIKIYLIKYRMKNGWEGVGFTGPITWSFTGLDDWQTLTPEDLVYCYTGWYIQFFFIGYQGAYKIDNNKQAEQVVLDLMGKGIISSSYYKVCDVFPLGDDLTYYVIEVIRNGTPVYLVGTKDNYIFYNKNFPPMKLSPLFYFLGKTFNPFREG